MKALEELAKHTWDFILYKTDEGFVLNVVFNSSFADYSRSFRVSESEANQDMEGLKQLSERIRTNYESFKDREITPVARK
ncbi:hypothetical protein GCM10027429_21380 [Marivirga atlantica]|uniref:Uncharacterized protein n=1 Tax=Marivirga atlantica TaxID=1548457 RepID=A0A937DJ90_9BACT|nr:hypothetical protein [Marivirga atlantica]MBL0765755.1 hypothetical protein [Marivirga atlantica]